MIRLLLQFSNFVDLLREYYKQNAESMKIVFGRDVRDQFLHVETETETQCNWSQFLILRLRLLKLVSNFETETETL